MVSIVLLRIGVNVLTLLLGAVFLMAGVTKLTPALDPKAHAHLVSEFPRFAEGLMVDKLGVNPDSLRLFVGVTEIVAAALLFTPAAMLGAVILMYVMIGAIFTHVSLAEPPTPAAVLGGLLYVLAMLMRRLTKARDAEARAAAVSAQKDK